MIRYTPSSERNLSLFSTPFEQSLSSDNRWVKMAEMVPWDKLAQVFLSSMSSGQGRPSVDLRVVLGTLLVKHIESLSDERAIEYIQENIYAQYFVGLSSFQTEPVFVPHLLVTIRKRLGEKGAARLNDLLIEEARRVKAIKHRQKYSDKTPPPEDDWGQNTDESPGSKSKGYEPDKSDVSDQKEVRNRGTLLVDATVAPAHIAYPTDSGILASSRQISEQLIDSIYEAYRSLWPIKPRTYRREAKRRYIAFSKKRRKTRKDIRKAVKHQLGYLNRNLQTIDKMLDKLAGKGLACPWSHKMYRQLWIIREVHRQQDMMFRDGRKRVDDRIVNITQPHIRPIKRGKGGSKNTEFGAKINASVTEGFLRADQLDFNNFNEANHLLSQIESYKELFGYYPGTVLADKIYWTRQNRNWLKTKGINIGGVPLGKKTGQTKYQREKYRKRNNKRSEIEGKFGESKSRYGLDELFTRLPQTTKAEISLIFLAINVVKMVREISNQFLSILFGIINGTRGTKSSYFYHLMIGRQQHVSSKPNNQVILSRL